MTCFGWTWEYIEDNVDLIRLKAINDYQRENPPIHQLVAAYMGVGESNNNTTYKEMTDEEREENAKSFIAFLQASGNIKQGQPRKVKQI